MKPKFEFGTKVRIDLTHANQSTWFALIAKWDESDLVFDQITLQKDGFYYRIPIPGSSGRINIQEKILCASPDAG